MAISWQGVFPAACTQFREDESLDLDLTMKHLDAMLAAGVSGLIMLGTVGENCSLTNEEKIAVLKTTVKHVNGRVPVLTGVSEYTTAMACRFVAAAKDAGVDGLMVLPAMVYPADERETIAHFRNVAQSTDLPVMIYNNPVSYKVDVKPKMFARLLDVKNIVAIKESSDDPRRLTDLVNLYGDRFILFCGVDDLALEGILLGAQGWISGLVNAFPQENQLLWTLAKAGKWEEARGVYRWYTPLLHLDTMPKLVQYIKLASAECGYGREICRAPRLKLEGAERAEILEIIRKAKATRPTAK